MSTSVRLDNRIDVQSKTTVLIGEETGTYAAYKKNSLPKVPFGRLSKQIFASIPISAMVKGGDLEVARAGLARLAIGSVAVVAGSREAFIPSKWENGDIEKSFGIYAYHGLSGVHTGAKAIAARNNPGDLSYMLGKWRKTDGKWQYILKNGDIQVGWQAIGGKWYYFNEEGIMQTGWVKVDGNRYYFHEDGTMRRD